VLEAGRPSRTCARALRGKTLAESLTEVGELLLIGANEAENRFLELYRGTAGPVVPGLDEVATAEA
jgi:hypothetical protein